MAGNVLTSDPLYFDTAGATSKITGPVKIFAIQWHGKGTAGDDLLIHDNDGGGDKTQRIIWEAVARTTNYVEKISFPGGRTFNGFYLTTLDTGTVLVYV